MAGKSTTNRASDNSLQRRRAERRANRGGNSVADWGTADPARVVELISVVTVAGGLCSFGYTRDGGTYTVTVILDGDKSTDYCRATENIDTFLGDLVEDFRDVG